MINSKLYDDKTMTIAHRAPHIPLPNDLGQVKLPRGQVDLSRDIFYILYKQIEKKKILDAVN